MKSPCNHLNKILRLKPELDTEKLFDSCVVYLHFFHLCWFMNFSIVDPFKFYNFCVSLVCIDVQLKPITIMQRDSCIGMIAVFDCDIQFCSRVLFFLIDGNVRTLKTLRLMKTAALAIVYVQNCFRTELNLNTFGQKI